MFARPDGTFFALTVEFISSAPATAELFSHLHWNLRFVTLAQPHFLSSKNFFRRYAGIGPFFRTYVGIFRVSFLASTVFYLSLSSNRLNIL